MDPAIIKQLLLATVPPGLAAALASLVLFRKGATAGPGAAGALAMVFAGVYAATHWFVLGTPPIPPVSGFDWLPAVAVLCAAGAIVAGATRGWMRPVVVGVVFLVCGGLSARNLIANAWSPGVAAAHLGGLVVAGTLAALGAGVVARAAGPTPSAVMFVAAAGAASVCEGAFQSLRLAQSAGVFAALFAGSLLVAMIRRSTPPGWAAAVGAWMVVVVVLFQGEMAEGGVIASLVAALAGAAPLAALAMPALRARPLLTAGVRIALAAAMPAAALVIALATRPDPAY